jgi:phage tail-like protein
MPTVENSRSNLATDPLRNFRFLVTFTPHDGSALNTHVGFTSVSGLSVTTESIPYREGGYNTSVHQIPGQSSFSPITMQRGVVLGTDDNWQWMKRLYKVVNANGTDPRGKVQDFRFNLQIKVLAHPMAGSATAFNPDGNTENYASENDLVALRFKVYNAWPTALAFSDLNAGDNALLVEQMTLVHEGFDMRWGNGTTDGLTTSVKESWFA